MKEKFTIFQRWLKDNYVTVLVVASLVGFIGYDRYSDEIKSMFNVASVSSVAPVQAPVQVPKIDAKCSKTEVEFILKNEDNLLKNREFIVIDLTTFKLTKREVKHNKEYTYYSRFGNQDEFYTVAKEINTSK